MSVAGVAKGCSRSAEDAPLPARRADPARACRAAAAKLGAGTRQLVFRVERLAPCSTPTTSPDRVLAPACKAAGVEWAGFHTFRHTVASRLFAEGRNVVQVQHWLGHHSASFTLDTYVHLLDNDLGEPLQAVALPERQAAA